MRKEVVYKRRLKEILHRNDRLSGLFVWTRPTLELLILDFFLTTWWSFTNLEYWSLSGYYAVRLREHLRSVVNHGWLNVKRFCRPCASALKLLNFFSLPRANQKTLTLCLALPDTIGAVLSLWNFLGRYVCSLYWSWCTEWHCRSRVFVIIGHCPSRCPKSFSSSVDYCGRLMHLSPFSRRSWILLTSWELWPLFISPFVTMRNASWTRKIFKSIFRQIILLKWPIIGCDITRNRNCSAVPFFFLQQEWSPLRGYKPVFKVSYPWHNIIPCNLNDRKADAYMATFWSCPALSNCQHIFA